MSNEDITPVVGMKFYHRSVPSTVFEIVALYTDSHGDPINYGHQVKNAEGRLFWTADGSFSNGGDVVVVYDPREDKSKRILNSYRTHRRS